MQRPDSASINQASLPAAELLCGMAQGHQAKKRDEIIWQGWRSTAECVLSGMKLIKSSHAV